MKAQHLPQRTQEVGAAQGHTPDKREGHIRPIGDSLRSQCIFWGKETAEAFGQSFDGGHIQIIRTAEGMQDVRLGLPRLGVAGIMGELDIGHGGTVFILSRNRSYVHVYTDSMYYLLCQAIKYNSHAYTFFSFPEVRTHDFSDLHHPKDQNMPTAVEAGINDLPQKSKDRLKRQIAKIGKTLSEESIKKPDQYMNKYIKYYLNFRRSEKHVIYCNY
jgi:hypothetical protein